MSNTLEKEKEMNYPKRGEMSDDGKFYTHTDGSVHETEIGRDNGCHVCSVDKSNERCHAECGFSSHFRLVEGAYVPSDEEREACDMARHQISICNMRNNIVNCRKDCVWFVDKTCPARLYLAAHKQQDAWVVK